MNINFYFSGIKARRAITGFYHSWMFGGGALGGTVIAVFFFFRNCQTVFQSGCTISHLHHQCVSAPDVLHSPQHLVGPAAIFNVSILLGHKYSDNVFV